MPLSCWKRGPCELEEGKTMSETKQLRPAIFWDRDGTLIEDRGHLAQPSEVAFLPNTISALRRLQDDFLFFIVTNQPGVAEGTISLRDVERVNAHVVSRLAEAGLRHFRRLRLPTPPCGSM